LCMCAASPFSKGAAHWAERRRSSLWCDSGWLNTADGAGVLYTEVAAPAVARQVLAPSPEREDFDNPNLPLKSSMAAISMAGRAVPPDRTSRISSLVRAVRRSAAGSVSRWWRAAGSRTASALQRWWSSSWTGSSTWRSVLLLQQQQIWLPLCLARCGVGQAHPRDVVCPNNLSRTFSAIESVFPQGCRCRGAWSVFRAPLFPLRNESRDWAAPGPLDVNRLSDAAAVPGTLGFTGAIVGLCAQDLVGTWRAGPSIISCAAAEISCRPVQRGPCRGLWLSLVSACLLQALSWGIHLEYDESIRLSPYRPLYDTPACAI
jgi:hypothetical protein